jgi:ferredoxin-NADP reductase
VLLAVLGGQLVHRVTLGQELLHSTLVRPQVLRAVIGTGLLVAAGVSSIRAVRRRISYESWYWVHTGTYVATYLAFGHQIRAGSHFVGSPANRWVWVVLYVGTAATVVVWRFLLPGLVVLRHRVRVAEIVPETAGVVSVWLHGPHLDELDVRGGQFFRFRFLARGQFTTAHPYSVSALPTGGRMRITVGALGDHSSAVSELVPGTLVLMHGPYGRFTADRVGGRRVLLIAGGVGIGPILTLAQDLSRQRRDVVVIHRGSSTDQLPLSAELAGNPRVRLIRVPGRRSELGYDPVSAPHLTRLVPDLAEREVFVCASAGLARSVTAALRSSGVPRQHIHLEQLSLS